MSTDNYKTAKSVYEFTPMNIQGDLVSLAKYRGHVLLIVNIASKCGLAATNNRELTELRAKYESRGLKILAFPCNQFLGQEPKSNEEIACFLEKRNENLGDLFAKIDVNGDNASPLWKYLKHKQGGTLGEFIKWNYTKFIVDKEGLRILGFPCNQFDGEEPDSDDEIECTMMANKTMFGELFSKIDVNGQKASPLWQFLKERKPGAMGKLIHGNYTKFIIDKKGQPVQRHGPNANPSSLTKHIEKYL